MTFLCSLLILLSGSTFAAASSLDLSGEWRFVLDPNDLGLKAGPSSWNFPDTITLPGTTALRKKGNPLEIDLNLEKPAMQHLHQRFPYLGPAWYQRTIFVPPDWKDRDIHLALERVLWESRVWIDQKPIGQPQLSLSVPHRYDLTDHLTPGKSHILTLRIDNRPKVDIGTIGHAYTEETQTIWNGVIGNLRLEALPKSRIDHLTVRTRSDGNLALTATGEFEKGQRLVVTLDGEHLITQPTPINVVLVTATAKMAQTWSELSPRLHELTVSLVAPNGDCLHSITRQIGFREIKADGRNLLINGQKTFLRGNLECAIFPQTGHPDADGPQWEKIMRTSREHGLNHLRFHSWCPPEAAFSAADQYGIYLQVELPNWTFEMGRKQAVDAFFLAEGKRILREYGHHPSFVLFSLGNELKGELSAMDKMIEEFRALAPDLLYTSTSYAFSPRGLKPGPQDDFFITQRSASGWVRGQGFLNSTFPTTDSDYSEGLASVPIPLVTHEVGQYVVYPNLAELPKYEETPLRSTAMEAIRRDLAGKGLLADAPRFTRDSGKLAALLYKEDIERALRTPDLAGIQLLQLQDFPGQSTASVGLLDAFWDSKGLITPGQFRRFCSPVVPLARMKKFVWENSETFTARLELANFSEAPITTSFSAKLIGPDGVTLGEKKIHPENYAVGNGLPLGQFEASLSQLKVATRLELMVGSADGKYENSWPLWIYPAEEATEDVIIHRAASDACLADLAAGRSVLLLPDKNAIRQPVAARFIPVFWSPLHFPNQPGTLGATIQTSHPLWRHFPTDSHTNWQWWELTAESSAVNLAGFDPAVQKPFRFIDKYNRNSLLTAIFEAGVGPGKLLVCTLDVTNDLDRRIAARQLGRALRNHLASPDFKPTGKLTPAQLRSLFQQKGITASASSNHPDYPASLATDSDSGTLWHSDWRKKNTRFPITLTLELAEAIPAAGFRIQNRNDSRNGRVKDFDLEISKDGNEWEKVTTKDPLPDSGLVQSVLLPKPALIRAVRFIARSSHTGQPLASLAELEIIPASAKDVRDLGLVPGFNN